MATNRVKKRDSHFTQVSNSFLRDENISFKAKGLFCYMFSMTEDWNFTIKSIAKQQKDGEASVISALKELRDAGYIQYTKNNDGSGIYYMDDEPKLENPNVGNPNLGKSTRIKNTQLTKNKNTKSTTLLDEFLQSDNSCTELTKNKAIDFIDYRKKIKKPLKTIAPLTAYIKTLRELIHEDVNIDEAIAMMKEREWQTLKVEYVLKEKKSSKVTSNFITTEIKGY